MADQTRTGRAALSRAPRDAVLDEPKPEGIRDRQTRETHERIYRTARRMFAERGFGETRVQDIAAEIGVSSVTIFNHFGSKNELLREVGEEYLGYFEQLIRELRGLAEQGTQGMAAYMGRAAQRFADAPPIDRRLATDAMRLILGEPAGTLVSRRIRHMLRDLIRFGQERGEARSDIDADLLAKMVTHEILGAFITWMNDPESDPRTLAGEVLTMVSECLRPRSDEPGSSG